MRDLYAFTDSSDPARILNRLRRLDASVPRQRGGAFQQTTSGRTTSLSGLYDATGKLILTSSNISTIGSISPSYNNMGFGIVATDVQATIYWDGINAGSQIIVLHRADGTRLAIPAGFVTVTGLTANTTYYALPFWGSASQCTIGWVPGTVGNPPILFTSITELQDTWQQNQANREPLTNTYIMFKTNTTSASYVAPITDPSGRPVSCVMSNTEIETVDDVEYETVHHHEENWWCIRAQNYWLNCTPNHRLYDAEGFPKQAQDFVEGERIVHKAGDIEVYSSGPFHRQCTKIQVMMPRVHLFWANGFLSHNIKMTPLPP